MLGGLLFSICLVFMGCGSSPYNQVMDNLSECTKVYYFGETEDFYCSLSSGMREDVYLLNGVSEKPVGFALMSFNFFESSPRQIVKLKVKINGEESEQELQINGVNSAYLVDLERELDGSEEIKINFEGQTLKLENISKNFTIGYQEALKIASEELSDKITAKKKLGKLNAECYLRVLDKNANNMDEQFWGFTVLNVDNESYSIVISTVDGSILAKSN